MTVGLQALSSTVQNATHPLLLERAIEAFGTTTPSLDAFLNQGTTQCNAFKAAFPEITLKSHEKIGVIQAAWWAFSGIFSGIDESLEPPKPIALSQGETFASLMEEGRQRLDQTKQHLNHLDDIYADHPDASGQIRAMREAHLFLETCPPTEAQGILAIQHWQEKIEKTLQRVEHLGESLQTTRLKQPADIFDSSVSIPKETIASLFSEDLGQKTNIATPDFQQALSPLKSFAQHTQDPVVLAAAEDAEEFHAIFQSLSSQLSKYPWARFIYSDSEYEQVFQPALLRFSNTITEKIAALDSKTRASFFIPLIHNGLSAQSMMNQDPNQFANILTGDFQKTLNSLYGTSYALMRVEPSDTPNFYQIHLYQSGQGANHQVFDNVSKDLLLNPNLLAQMLKRISIVGKAEELKTLRTLIGTHWESSLKDCESPPASREEEMQDWLLRNMKCLWTQFSSTAGNTLADRMNDGAQSFLAALGLPPHVEKTTSDFCIGHFGSPSVTSSHKLSSMESNNPWGPWQSLFLTEGKIEQLLDYQLAMLTHFTQETQHSETEMEERIELSRQALASLNKQYSEITSIPSEKILEKYASLNQIKQLIDAQKGALDLAFNTRNGQVRIAPDFGSFSQPIAMPKIQTAITDVPNPPAKLQLHTDLTSWIPSVNNLEPLYDLAEQLKEDYQAERYDGVIYAVKMFYNRFNPLSAGELLNSITPETAEHIFLALDAISTLYFKSYFDATVPKLPDAESTLLMMETMILADSLLAKLPASHKLSQVRMPITELFPYIFNRGIFFRMGDPELDKRLGALQAYCKKNINGLEDAILFKTNMAPLKQQFAGALLGDGLAIPKIIAMADKRSHQLFNEETLLNYLEKFLPAYKDKHLARTAATVVGSRIDPLLDMWTGTVDDVLPKTFYAARQMAYHVGYFFRGTFVKPANFQKTPNSFDLTFEKFSLIDATAPPGMSSIYKAEINADVVFLYAKLNGMDASVFTEHQDLPNGLSSAHQLQHLQRPPNDPIIQQLQEKHLKKQNDPTWYAFFGSYHKPFESFAPGITEAGRNIYDLNVVMVQETAELKKYLTKQQYEIFASLRTEPAMQIANTLSFFRKNPDLLHKPDIQSYFLNLIFDPPLLTEELKLQNRGPELEKQLADFASGEYSLYSRLGNHEIAQFYLGLIARLHQYSLSARAGYPKVYQTHPLPQAFQTFPKLLTQAIEQTPLELQGTLHGLAAQQWMSASSLKNDREILEFLRHVILYHRFPPSGKTIDPLLSDNIKRLLVRFSPAIANIEKTPEFFRQIAKEAFSDLPSNAEYAASKENPLVFTVKDHPIAIDLQRGLVSAPGIAGIPLPADGLNHPIYTSLYGNKEFRCTALSRSAFEFTDHQNHLNRLIRQPGGDYVIQRKFHRKKDLWYQYVPRKFLTGQREEKRPDGNEDLLLEDRLWNLFAAPTSEQTPLLPAAHLIEGHTHWYSDSIPGELLILSPAGRIAYRAQIGGSELLNTENSPRSLNAIYQVDAQGNDRFALVNLKQPDHPFSWVSQFEDPEHILIWKDPDTHETARIEFPRYGLSFSKEGTRFQSEQFTGYSLKQRQIHPLGTHCPNFLILENSKGEEKLILTAQKIVPSKTGSLRSHISFDRSEKLAGTKQAFYTYDTLSEEKTFSSERLSNNLYLGMLHGAKKQYKDAISLLRKSAQTDAPFSEEEKEILKSIIKLDQTMQNDSPKLTALRSLAYVLLETNKKNHPPKTQESNDSIPNPAPSYFQAASDLGLFRLDFDEEFALLQHGLLQQPNPLMAGIIQPLLTAIQQLAKHDEQRARDLLVLIGKGELPDPSTIQQMLQAPLPSDAKLPPHSPIHLEGILTTPLNFVNILSAAGNKEIQAQHLNAILAGQGASPIEQRAFEFYLKDCLAYLEKKDNAEYSLKDPIALKQKRIELEKTHKYLREALAQSELAILRLAAKLPKDPIEKARIIAKSESNALSPFELNELILLFMDNKMSVLKKKNPELTDSDIQALDQMVDLFLDLFIQNAQRGRIAEKMQDIENLQAKGFDDPNFKLALASFVAEANVQRHYDGSKNRFLKVFEYHNGFYYRKNQIEMLGNLGVQLEGSQTQLFESLIREMMVGAGKTTYLLPTIGFWKADGKRLSAAVMTEVLIKNMAPVVERILGKTFAQKIKKFQFNRNTDLSKENLTNIVKMLNHAIENKEFLITTDKSLKAFVNQYIKVLHDAFSKTEPELAEKAELMRQIYKIFKEKADVLVDEADLIYNPRNELNFPSGEAVPIDAPLLSLTLKIYELLISPEIAKLASFEFAPTSKDPCTPKTYEEKVKPALARQIGAFLGSSHQDSRFGKIQAFYQKLSLERKQELEHYFLGQDPNHVAEHWIEAISDADIKNAFGLIRGEINLLLPLTLQKNYGERYGFHTEESIYAGPFSASNDPNIGSLFSDPFERINYTIQAYLKEPGIRRPIIENLIHDLQAKAMKELSDQIEIIKKLPATEEYETQAHKEFKLYFGKKRDLFHPQIVEQLVKDAATDPKVKFNLMETYVLPQITIYKQNLKATSQTNAFLFGNIKGFTGTLWNKGTFHDKFLAEVDSGARGQIIALLAEQAKDRVATITIKKPSELHQELLIDNPQYHHIQVLIDAGGALREFDIRSVAKQWLEKSDASIEGVAYFNKEGKAMIWERGKPESIPLEMSRCPLEKRKMIYDQKHTTGTDVKQAINAKALLVLSKKMIMRDFIQAVGRMRQLSSGQRVEIAILEQDAAAIREYMHLEPNHTLTIEDVIRFLILNEVQRQTEDNQVATTHKLTAVVQEWFLDQIRKLKHITQIPEGLKNPAFIENLFFQTNSISPFLQYGQGMDLIESQTAYANKIEKLSEKLGIDQSSFLQSSGLRKLMQTVIENAELPKQILSSEISTDMEEEQEIQQEQEMEQETEQELQQEEQQQKREHRIPDPHFMWDALNQYSVTKAAIYQPNINHAPSFLPVNQLMPTPIFDPNLLVSTNYPNQLGTPFGESHKPVQNILIVQNQKTSQFQLFIVDPFDAGAFKSALQTKYKESAIEKDPDLHKWFTLVDPDYFSTKNKWKIHQQNFSHKPAYSSFYNGDDVRLWIGDLSLKSAYESNPPISKRELESSTEVKRLLVQAKYFNGDVAYSQEELPILKQWLSEAAGSSYFSNLWNPSARLQKIQEIEEHFRKTIIAFRDQSKRDYQKSALKKIFEELREGI